MPASAPAVAVLALFLPEARGGVPGTAMMPGDDDTNPPRVSNGKVIRVAQLPQPEETARHAVVGRAAGESGLPFHHGRPGRFSSRMFPVNVPRDITRIDSRKRIVQVVHHAPPCGGPEEKGPVYGGGEGAQSVLELRAGVASIHGPGPGEPLDF